MWVYGRSMRSSMNSCRIIGGRKGVGIGAVAVAGTLLAKVMTAVVAAVVRGVVFAVAAVAA